MKRIHKYDYEFSALRVRACDWLVANGFAPNVDYDHMLKLLGVRYVIDDGGYQWEEEHKIKLKILLGPYGKAYYHMLKAQNEKDNSE